MKEEQEAYYQTFIGSRPDLWISLVIGRRGSEALEAHPGHA